MWGGQPLFTSYLEVLVSYTNKQNFGRCNLTENVIYMNETHNIMGPFQLELFYDSKILWVLLSSLTPHELSEILGLLFMDIVAYLLHALLQTLLAVLLSEF